MCYGAASDREPFHATHPFTRARRRRFGGPRPRARRARGWSHHVLRQRLGTRARPSQWGAYGLATKGWSSTKILTHFYSGTKVTKSVGHPGDIRIALASAEDALHLTAAAGPVRLSVKKAVGGTPVGKIPDGET